MVPVNSGSFIERHGLVRYTGRLGRKYPRTGECEVGACRLIRQHAAEYWGSLMAEDRAQLGRVLDDLAALADHRAAVVAQRPAGDEGRRARHRELDHARLRRIALDAERDRLGRKLDRYAVAVELDAMHAEQLAARTLMFDHCHVHGWVRGLVCHDCNVLLGAADAGRLTADDPPWASVLMAYRRNCPDCRALDGTGEL
jgi:hypothetical protein